MPVPFVTSSVTLSVSSSAKSSAMPAFHRRARSRPAFAAVLVAALAFGTTALAQSPGYSYTPDVGQAGKDVVWVPTPQPVVDKMLELANITPKDTVLDLGSGDGRTVITAAKRGVKAHGVEYNPDMAALARANAEKEGVSKMATFQTADLFEIDLSQATVITMFLLPTINERLRPKLLELPAGTRVVSNSFPMGDWKPDRSETVSQGCSNYCTALMWVVPAKAAGTWQMDGQRLTLKQSFQNLEGTLGSNAISDAKLEGKKIAFTANGVRYEGMVDGNAMKGTAAGGKTWSARKS
ncbi:methyltransferase [Pigmentiphaga litoralis]|uniref:SAM-dependent methyltransferase n=1 Tax=Pigmentiphaga litoralis TaxID=516702 RepID=UPI0019A488C4|nr:class I SAM-dependent methyltransferase [Pigmentiphaga litoralis]GGX18614.1 methyltransferase [Pigmentiphaga litoralis]